MNSISLWLSIVWLCLLSPNPQSFSQGLRLAKRARKCRQRSRSICGDDVAFHWNSPPLPGKVTHHGFCSAGTSETATIIFVARQSRPATFLRLSALFGRVVCIRMLLRWITHEQVDSNVPLSSFMKEMRLTPKEASRFKRVGEIELFQLKQRHDKYVAQQIQWDMRGELGIPWAGRLKCASKFIQTRDHKRGDTLQTKWITTEESMISNRFNWMLILGDHLFDVLCASCDEYILYCTCRSIACLNVQSTILCFAHFFNERSDPIMHSGALLYSTNIFSYHHSFIFLKSYSFNCWG